jgi:pSer/pThr/pTyr-binding forkhead associated (FHA) protein
MIPSEPAVAEMAAMASDEVRIVLKPLSHPHLGQIVIDDNLFAIGRSEAPFASYLPEIVEVLSRRQARIFTTQGVAYIADLESKNGTTVNGAAVREKPRALRHGDEICFGGELSYRVELGLRPRSPQRATQLIGLTLKPERADGGLEPIVISRFPYLISKQDEAFARYQDAHPHQVSYLSRRHAHIFVRGGMPFVEDLGSTNGSFVNGKRLDEHAAPLEDGDVVAFGGKHFVYRVALARAIEAESTVTRGFAPVPAQEPGDPEKTTFVASAASFLDIFCVDGPSPNEDEINGEAPAQPDRAPERREPRRRRGRFATLLVELARVFVGEDPASLRQGLSYTALFAVALSVFGCWLYVQGSPEREVKELFAGAEYARAAAAAHRHLERNPESVEIRNLGGQALLKAKVPAWLAALRARDFQGAGAVLAEMKAFGSRNPDVAALIGELEWMGELERFVAGRGGVEAPIRIYADEGTIRVLLKQWNDDTQRHRRAFATISSHVPAFSDAYAETLSNLRKLQNDESVYLAAIERLQAAIGTELERNTPEALDAVLADYAEKYPRLALDGVRGDLRQYVALEKELRARRVGRLLVLLGRAKFATPPFEAAFRRLAASDRFPPGDLVREYETVAKAWREGATAEALAGLQRLATGPWAGPVRRELEQKKAVLERHAVLQRARDGSDYEARLLEFYGSLDPDEDVHFVRVTQSEVARYKDGAVARARDSVERAEALWRRYRDAGAIDGRQRLQAAVSGEFRAQAQLLLDAHEAAQLGRQLHTQLKLVQPARWALVQDEIRTELEQQRRALLELRHVLDPGLLRAKLVLLGGPER